MSANKIGPDPSVLLKMNAPLNVQVMRVRANQREPIPLPVRNGFNASGLGWTHEDLQTLDQEILEIAAGGIYEIQVVDSSEPRQSHKWQVVFPPDVYGPSKPPTTMAGYANPAAPMPPQPQYAQQPPPYGYGHQPQYGQRPPTPIMGPYGNPYAQAHAQPYGVPPFHPYGQPAFPGMPFGYGQPFPGAPPFGHAPQAAPTSEVEALKNELAAMRLASVQADAQRKLEEIQAQHRREMESIRRAPQNDEKYEREREAKEKAERDAFEARLRAEKAEADAKHVAQLEALKAQAPRHDDAAERRFEAQMAEERRRFDQMKADSDRRFDLLTAELTRMREAPRGPDPFMMMLELRRAETDAAKETARINAETARETERLRVEQTRLQAELQAKSLGDLREKIIDPVELARLLHDASKSGDEVTRTMLGQFTDIMNLQQQATQAIMGMQPQGEGVAGRAVAIAERIADRFTTGDTQVRVAQANAARAQAEAARVQMQSMQPGWQPPPPVVQPGAQPQLNGATTPTVEPQAATPSAPAAQPPQATQPAQPAAPAANATPSPLRAGGKTDEEWFGLALGDVMNLRTGAAMFLDAVSVEPPKTDKEGNVPGLQPDQAAYGLMVASNEVTKRPDVKVLAFEVLWNQQMYAQLIDVLLPDVVTQFGQNGQMYKQEMFKYLERLLNGLPLHTPEELAEMEQQGVDPGPSADDAQAANGNGAPPPAPPAPTPPPTPAPKNRHHRPRP